VEKIPTLKIDAQAEVKISDDEQTMMQNTTVTMESDLPINSPMSSFQSVIEVVNREIPEAMKTHKGVPIRAMLMPLNHLDSKIEIITREISRNLIDECYSILKGLNKFEAKASDLLSDSTVIEFKTIRTWLTEFTSNIVKFRHW